MAKSRPRPKKGVVNSGKCYGQKLIRFITRCLYRYLPLRTVEKPTLPRIISGTPLRACTTMISRKLHRPVSTIYSTPQMGDGLAQRLTSSGFDLSKPSGRSKHVKPHGKHDAPRGQPGVRDLGHHKTGEFGYYKR